MKKLIINRKDMKNNLKILRKILNSAGKDDSGNNTEIIGVVKGNGMGLGLIDYSKFLVNNGINFLAVANTDEAIKIREAGIAEKILNMTPTSNKKELELLLKNDIIITVSSLSQIEIIEKICEEEELKAKAHVKIDTGFGRYGFMYDNFENIIEVFKMCNKIEICGTYTHFARPLDEKFTNVQFERFLECIKIIKKENYNPGILHCSESTAMLKYNYMNLNAVRIGSFIQGRTLVPIQNLKKIGQFITKIEEIKTVPKGYNISYGNMYRTKRETKIAVIPVGYMDGLNMRKARDIFSFKENFKSVGIEIKKFFKDNRLKVTINNKKYDIIGRIGMYHAVIDITGSDNIKIEDEVIVPIEPLQVNSMIRREYI